MKGGRMNLRQKLFLAWVAVGLIAACAFAAVGGPAGFGTVVLVWLLASCVCALLYISFDMLGDSW